MTDGQDSLSLMVTIPAAELALLRRRNTYLEAALVQLMRGQSRVKEWFSAAELAALRLPGLPHTKAAITRLARAEGWSHREVACQGGQRHDYHFSSLPRRAFDALIDRVLKAIPEDDGARHQAPQLPAPPPPEPETAAGSAAPPWLLPLMRVIRAEAPANVGEALDLLPRYLPAGIPCPAVDEVLPELQRLGMLVP